MSDGTNAGRATLLDTLSRSLDPALVQLQPRVLGDAPHDVLTELSERHPVVEIRWETPRRAVIRAALKPQSWTSRTVEFGARDPLVERAKTLGFAVAAMMPQWRAETAVVNPPLLEVVPLSESDFAVWAPPVELVDAGVVVAEPEEAAPIPEAGGIEARPVVTRAFISLLATGQLPQLLGGGGVDGAYCVFDWLCIGAQVTFGGGSVSNGAVSHLELRTLALADVRLFPWSAPFGLTARGTGGAVMVAATRGSQTLTRWTGTGGFEVGGALRVGRFDVTLTAGPTFSGPTSLVVDGLQVATIAAVQAAARLGVSFRF